MRQVLLQLPLPLLGRATHPAAPFADDDWRAALPGDPTPQGVPHARHVPREVGRVHVRLARVVPVRVWQQHQPISHGEAHRR